MRKSIYALSLSTIPLLASPAFAQVALDEIVVTANRVESLASETPIALSAITGDSLRSLSVTNPTQLSDVVPNLSIVRGNGLQITIRGVTSSDGTEKGDPSAAFLSDGIYIGRPQMQEASFFDVQRVEVLRGPQGTLYGRNTTAGVINVLSNRPTQDFEASVDASYGNYNHITTTGVINMPVNDKLALRAAMNFDQRDSFIRKKSDDNFDIDPFKDNLSFRLSALYDPTPDLSIYLKADYNEMRGQPLNSVPTSNFYTGSFTEDSTPLYVDRNSARQRRTTYPELWQGYRDDDDKGVSGEVNWDAGAVTITYLGSYRESSREQHATGRAGNNRTTFNGDYWQNSQELRFALGDDGPWTAQFGGYYFKEKSGIAFFFLDASNILTIPGVNRFGFPQDPTIAKNVGAFGQGTYEVMPNLKLTAGMRYSKDSKSRVGATVADLFGGTRLTLQENNASEDYSKVTWRLGADYIMEDLGLLYASVSTGYKAGGFNDGCEKTDTSPAACVSTYEALYYEPETLTAYEVGFKLHNEDSSIRLDGSLFHYDYTNLQLSSVVDACGGPCQITTNAGKAKINGVELESYFRPGVNHLISLSMTWIDAHYSEFQPNPNVDLAGHPLSRSPEWTWTAAYNYSWPLSNNGSIVFDARTRYSSRYDLTDLATLVYFYQPAYTQTGISVTYNAPDDKYYVQGFVNNLEDNVVVTSVVAGATPTATFADPRTYGIRAGVKF